MARTTSKHLPHRPGPSPSARAWFVIVGLSVVGAGCGSDGREHVVGALGVERADDYRGVVSGFQGTYYDARFVADPAEVEAAAQRLGLRRLDATGTPNAVADGPFDGPGPPPRPDWWRPDDELSGAVVYLRTWTSPGSSRVDSTYAVGVHPETGVTYAVLGYP